MGGYLTLHRFFRLAAVPYLIINLVMIGIILLFPKIALFLPNLLH